MTRLSVNINKIATLRNARGGNIPNVLQCAIDCQLFGADGITVHPRPDERHIRYQDVYDIKPAITTEYNIEGYPEEKFMKLVKDIKPDQVTLVPDLPSQVTSNFGWDAVANKGFLTEITKELKASGIRVSIFIGATLPNVESAAEAGADRVELYTEPYATMFPQNAELAVAPFVEAAKLAHKLGLGINAGHDLSLLNLKYINEKIPYLDEVSIGHALISDALYLGLEKTIQAYQNCLIK
ncbi:MAG: pyridoxine 5'-phosphate synthase [Bacteroidota bacterium]|nr:pyridoxine 5'-phosphate synthase [Bacteroidota bacterium]MDP4205180.1 pyridoxine 5'-phosphate synthase [Bacteroidota bacterium]